MTPDEWAETVDFVERSDGMTEPRMILSHVRERIAAAISAAIAEAREAEAESCECDGPMMCIRHDKLAHLDIYYRSCAERDALAVRVNVLLEATSRLMYHVHSEPRVDGNHVYRFRSIETLGRTMNEILPLLSIDIPRAAKIAEAQRLVCEAADEWDRRDLTAAQQSMRSRDLSAALVEWQKLNG